MDKQKRKQRRENRKQQHKKRRVERHNENKEIFKKFKSDFCKRPISSTSELICSLSANNQGAMTIVVAVFFILFTVAVGVKNFYNYSEDDCEVIRNFYHFAGFSVDFITLPFLIITVTFTALGSFYTSKFQLNVENNQYETKNMLNQLYIRLGMQAMVKDIEDVLEIEDISEIEDVPESEDYPTIEEVKRVLSDIISDSEYIIPDKPPQAESICPDKPTE